MTCDNPTLWTYLGFALLVVNIGLLVHSHYRLRRLKRDRLSASESPVPVDRKLIKRADGLRGSITLTVFVNMLLDAVLTDEEIARGDQDWTGEGYKTLRERR